MTPKWQVPVRCDVCDGPVPCRLTDCPESISYRPSIDRVDRFAAWYVAFLAVTAAVAVVAVVGYFVSLTNGR